MYLHEVTVKNYSIHRESKFVLYPITVLVGPNGGGKSAFFDALLNFSMLSRGNIGQAFGQYPYSFTATRYRGSTAIARISFEVVLSHRQGDAERLRYKVDYSQQGKAEGGVPKFEIHTELLQLVPSGEVLFDRNDPDASKLPAATTHLAADTGIFAAVRKAAPDNAGAFPEMVASCAREISRFSKFRLDSQNLASASNLPDLTTIESPRLAYEGENLAGALYFLHETSNPAYGTIVAELRKVIPGFDEFDFNTVGTQRIGFSVRFSDQRQSIPGPRLSDGQRLLIGLMTLIYSPDRPPILQLEEPENGLTAPAQRAFYQAIRHLAVHPNEAERSQVLISSHSPFVLCEAWNGEDRDFVYQVKVEDGRAMVRSFKDAVHSSGITLGKTPEGRVNLGLKNAEDLMSGHLS